MQSRETGGERGRRGGSEERDDEYWRNKYEEVVKEERDGGEFGAESKWWKESVEWKKSKLIKTSKGRK